MSIQVLLADDHPVVYEGIVCACRPYIEVEKYVDQIADIESAVLAHQTAILITEVRINGQDALKVIDKVRESKNDLIVVVFSGWDNPTHIARAASLGVADFVAKTQPMSALIRAVESASANQPPPENSLIVTTQSKLRRPRQSHDFDVPLTNREMQVLRHVSMGLSNREVAKSLTISVETVKEHVQNILRKLNVNDRTQAAVWAVKRGLV